MDRRKFLAGSAAVVASAALPGPAVPSAAWDLAAPGSDQTVWTLYVDGKFLGSIENLKPIGAIRSVTRDGDVLRAVVQVTDRDDPRLIEWLANGDGYATVSSYRLVPDGLPSVFPATDRTSWGDVHAPDLQLRPVHERLGGRGEEPVHLRGPGQSVDTPAGGAPPDCPVPDGEGPADHVVTGRDQGS